MYCLRELNTHFLAIVALTHQKLGEKKGIQCLVLTSGTKNKACTSSTQLQQHSRKEKVCFLNFDILIDFHASTY